MKTTRRLLCALLALTLVLALAGTAFAAGGMEIQVHPRRILLGKEFAK